MQMSSIETKNISADVISLDITKPKRNINLFPDGYLKLVVGCMFSGKTTYIINECKKWQSIGKQVLMINYNLDIRYSNQDKIISHDQYSIDCVMIDKLTQKLTKQVELYDVILINEGQFFSELKLYVNHWCDELKKIVVVSGLDGDFTRSIFGEIIDLIPNCDDYVKLKAYCSTCKDGTCAIFTWKIKDRPIVSLILELINMCHYVENTTMMNVKKQYMIYQTIPYLIEHIEYETTI